MGLIELPPERWEMEFTDERDFSTKTVTVDAPRAMVEALMRTAADHGNWVTAPISDERGSCVSFGVGMPKGRAPGGDSAAYRVTVERIVRSGI